MKGKTDSFLLWILSIFPLQRATCHLPSIHAPLPCKNFKGISKFSRCLTSDYISLDKPSGNFHYPCLLKKIFWRDVFSTLRDDFSRNKDWKCNFWNIYEKLSDGKLFVCWSWHINFFKNIPLSPPSSRWLYNHQDTSKDKTDLLITSQKKERNPWLKSTLQKSKMYFCDMCMDWNGNKVCHYQHTSGIPAEGELAPVLTLPSSYDMKKIYSTVRKGLGARECTVQVTVILNLSREYSFAKQQLPLVQECSITHWFDWGPLANCDQISQIFDRVFLGLNIFNMFDCVWGRNDDLKSRTSITEHPCLQLISEFSPHTKFNTSSSASYSWGVSLCLLGQHHSVFMNYLFIEGTPNSWCEAMI